MELSAFTATAGNGQVTLNWTTESEENNAGFHLYRATALDGAPLRLTRQLIRGAGNSTRRHDYTYLDRWLVNNDQTYFYWLEDVDFLGQSKRHGPLQATPVGPVYAVVSAFAGQSSRYGIELAWTTEREDNLAYFNLYRRDRETGQRHLVEERIMAQGGADGRGHYTFVDQQVVIGWHYWYELESVSGDGHMTLHGMLGVLLEKDAGVPDQFSLEANYPNPFNPATRIGFSVPGKNGLDPGVATRVHLSVYNLLGQEVVQLVDDQRPPGFYQVVWDGRSGQGQLMPSGVYLYRIEVGRHSAVRKMTLLK